MNKLVLLAFATSAFSTVAMASRSAVNLSQQF